MTGISTFKIFTNKEEILSPFSGRISAERLRLDQKIKAIAIVMIVGLALTSLSLLTGGVLVGGGVLAVTVLTAIPAFQWITASYKKSNLTRCCNHFESPEMRALILESLDYADILTEDNCEKAMQNLAPQSLVRLLTTLRKAGLLSEELFEISAAHENLADLTRITDALHSADMLSEENFKSTAKHPNAWGLAMALQNIEARLLSEECFTALLAHQDLINFSRSITSLKKADKLTSENLWKIAKQQDPVQYVKREILSQ